MDGYAGTVTATCDDAEEVKVDKVSDKEYRVRIPNIMAHELGGTYNVDITTNSGTFTVKVSGLSYVHAILNNTALRTTNNLNAVISLYDYYAATKAYTEKEGE